MRMQHQSILGKEELLARQRAIILGVRSTTCTLLTITRYGVVRFIKKKQKKNKKLAVKHGGGEATPTTYRN